jgi:hypothetical protein
MARKRQRRYFPTRRPTNRARPDDAERQGQIDALANQLLNQHTPAELQALLAERTMQLEEADRAGTFDPGPGSLSRFHAARQAWEIANRAVELAQGNGARADED